jgi:hypothetical protein
MPCQCECVFRSHEVRIAELLLQVASGDRVRRVQFRVDLTVGFASLFSERHQSAVVEISDRVDI